MERTELKVKITFTEEILGTANNDPEIHDRFIASKAPDAEKAKEEVQAIDVDEEIKLSMTVFPKLEDGTPFMWDYMIRGLFKDATSVLRTVKGTKSEKVKAFKKYIDGRIFVEPRKIPIECKEKYPNGEYIGHCQRPLRASTAQGERVALAHSEAIKAGATCEFTVVCLEPSDIAWVKELLEYGQYKGLGQWRNSGKGRFTVEFLN